MLTVSYTNISKRLCLYTTILLIFINLTLAQEQTKWSYEPSDNITMLLSLAEDTIRILNDSNYSTDYVEVKFLHAKDELNYGGNKQLVLELLNDIGKLRAQILYLMDYIPALDIKTNEYEKMGIDVTEGRDKLKRAKEKMRIGLYNDAESLANEVDTLLDAKYSYKYSTESMIKAGTSQVILFFRKRLKLIIISFVILFVVVLIGLRLTYSKRLKKKIKLLELEEKTLEDLVKETQRDYFKKKVIPAPVYKIKIDSYRKKLAEVKQKLMNLKKKEMVK